MATGDKNDILSRLKALLPAGWFSDTASNLNALLSGPANALSSVYNLIAYVRLQCRIKTATDGFLDMISLDYFGDQLPRYQKESDTAFRNRIIANLLSEKGTRAGLIRAVTLLVGVAPWFFEPGRVQDTGGWGHGNTYNGLAYGYAGGWGSLQLNCQAFMKVARPPGAGVPNVGGWGSYAGGYGVGSTEWINQSMVYNAVSDTAIYQTISNAKMAGTTIWTQIS